ncbi:hypothetical protein [Paraherbaspirillum soli]|uniref:Type II secretion system protein GspC N-terminal domain-containing protein n=1 Tax=Paraherbaspirillum soli TaxID=631222 RepID=A0ABW0MC47_9BURK
MNEKKFALAIGIAGFALIALIVYLTAPDLAPQSPIALLPAGTPARAMPTQQNATTIAATVNKTAAECSTKRLDAWRLVSLAAGGYRQGGFAVLNNDRRGTLTVSEAQIFDGNLLLAKVTGNSVELRCDHIVQTKILTDSRDAAAVPAMRTALPDPSNN